MLETHDQIIGITHDDDVAGSFTPSPALRPQVENAVQVDVAKPTFSPVSGLGSADSATGCPALFAGFTATMPESDFSCPFIIGYGSSPSRCGPVRLLPPGRAGDLPGSDAFLSSVMWP